MKTQKEEQRMFSHKKGQSALEYLMTYGWALVVIVVVIAALVLLVGGQGNAPVCQNPGSGFSVSNQNLTNGAALAGGWEIRVSNITGRNMTFQAPTAAPTWTPAVAGAAVTDVELNGAAIAAQTLPSGASAVVTVGNPAALTAGTKYNTTVTLNYTDPDGFARTIPINCTGVAP